MPAAAVVLLTMRLRSHGYEAIARALTASGLDDFADRDLGAVHDALMQRINARAQQPLRTPFGFWLRFDFVPEAIVVKFAPLFAAAYTPAGAAAFLALIAACYGWLLYATRLALPDIRGVAGFAALACTLASSAVFHELGHAAAASKFRVRPGAIGFTMYLTFPALFSDMTRTWTLDRRRRVIVDLGGSYFQLVFGGICAVLYLTTGYGAFDGAALGILVGTAVNLNPLFKFDGYWVVADAFGVANLSAIVSTVLLDPNARRRYAERLGRRSQALLLSYALATALGWAYLTYAIAMQGIVASKELLQSYLLGTFVQRLHDQPLIVLVTVASLCISLIVIVRVLRRFVRLLGARWLARRELRSAKPLAAAPARSEALPLEDRMRG